MKQQKWAGAACLLVAAAVWGFGFVAQDLGANHVGAFTFQAARTLLAALALLLLWVVRDLWRRKKGTYRPMDRRELRFLLIGGAVCGTILATAAGLQQLGIGNNVTSPGKDAFITALYIVLVPVLSLPFGKRARPHVYLCVVAALIGLWLLCMGGSSLTLGDVQVIACSLVFACHIIAVDLFIPHVDGLRLSCLQFFVNFLLSGALMLIFEQPTAAGLSAAGGAILYSGLVSAGVGYTLQIVGQAHTPPTVASLLMSLESVFAVLASILLLPGVPAFTAREIFGMLLIFAAIILSQLQLGRKKEGTGGRCPRPS